MALKEAGKASEKPPITKTLLLKELVQNRILKNARISVRDFIHNSLYNEHYGYFTKNAVVFSPPKPFEFNEIRNNNEFFGQLSILYQDLEKKKQQQIWHTPTELFQPFYGEAIAKCLLEQYKLHPTPKLKIFEIGAGNGTLMKNIMDFIKKTEPTIYESTEYVIIEISPKLAQEQKTKIKEHHVSIVNKSIFDYKTIETEPCFFLAMEVLDNLSHDLIRYDTETYEPVQGVVLVDVDGDFEEAFEPLSDPLLKRYLDVRNQVGYTSPMKQSTLSLLQKLNPIPANLSGPEFVPTNAFQLIEKLHECFPNHKVIFSDFHALPQAIPGIDGPVVQTRYKQSMVPCSTYLVQPGLFDIFFPTNFELLSKVYKQVTGKETIISTHQQFIKQYADLEKTRTKSGESPILQYYENVSFFITK